MNCVEFLQGFCVNFITRHSTPHHAPGGGPAPHIRSLSGAQLPTSSPPSGAQLPTSCPRWGPAPHIRPLSGAQLPTSSPQVGPSSPHQAPKWGPSPHTWPTVGPRPPHRGRYETTIPCFRYANRPNNCVQTTHSFWKHATHLMKLTQKPCKTQHNSCKTQ